MERTEEFVPKISEWLAANLQDMHQTSKQIMKLINEDRSSVQEIEGHDLNKPQLLTLFQEFSSMYQALTDQYAQITGDPEQTKLHMEGQEAIEPGLEDLSLEETPNGKVQALNSEGADVFFSSGGGSFENSPEEGTFSSQSSSSDSESEHFRTAVNGYLETVGLGQQRKKSEPGVEPIYMSLFSEEAHVDDSAKKSVYGSYDELIERISHYEGEFKVLNLKLKQSEEEVAQLKGALNKSDEAAQHLQAHLDAVKNYIGMKDVALEEATCKAMQLEKRIIELESSLEKSTEHVAILTAGLDSARQEVIEVGEKNSTNERVVSERENEIRWLKAAFSETLANQSKEKEQMRVQWDLQQKELEESLRRMEDDKNEQIRRNLALVESVQDVTSKSQVSIEERDTRIGSLNKELDQLKLRHDMVVAGRDELNARVQSLSAVLSRREHCLTELSNRSLSVELVMAKLKIRVQELEEEVEMQKSLVSDGAEKKREAIRQLCFSLEHYRTGYHELREAFIGRKRHAVLVS